MLERRGRGVVLSRSGCRGRGSTSSRPRIHRRAIPSTQPRKRRGLGLRLRAITLPAPAVIAGPNRRHRTGDDRPEWRVADEDLDGKE